MAKDVGAIRLPNLRKAEPKVPVIGVFAACDPRVDEASRTRSRNIIKMTADAIANSSNVTWPHTWIVPKYAGMAEYKQYAPANHFHMTWNLPVARLQYWMDLTGVLSITPWAARPKFIEGVDRPQPLIHPINGGEDTYKALRSRR